MFTELFAPKSVNALNSCSRRFTLRNAGLSTMAVLVAFASLQAHASCRGDILPSATPTSDFTVNIDGTVTHNPTGLMWKQCQDGLSDAACATGTALDVSWPNALAAAKNSAFAGYSDWRLPNRKELESLVDDSCAFPAINSTVFPGRAGGLAWTSTTAAGETSLAWFVLFGDGSSNTGSKSDTTGAVRLVRAGQTFDTPLPELPILNIDDSDAATQYSAATDGVLLIRYLFGLRGSALTDGALGTAPQRSAAQIEAHIAANLMSFDVDNDASVLATTDGLMILRRLLGLSGPALTAGAKNSARSDVDVAAAIDALKP